MSDSSKDDITRSQAIANDNGAHPPVRVEVVIPANLPIQRVEIEIFAELLECLQGLVANDN